MLQKRRFVFKILILVWALMLLEVSLKCFLCPGEGEVLEEIINETVEDTVVMNQLPSSCQHWHRAASLTHTVGLFSLRQHCSGFGLLLYPTLEMLQKMIPDPTEGLTAIDEAAARYRALVDSQAHLGRGFYKQRIISGIVLDLLVLEGWGTFV